MEEKYVHTLYDIYPAVPFYHPIIGNNWAFQLTPFIQDQDPFPFHPQHYSPELIQNLNNPYDFCFPLKCDVDSGHINTNPPKLSVQKYLIFLEVSQGTKFLIPNFLQSLKYFASKPHPLFLTIIPFHHQILFPIIHKKNSTFSLGTIGDITDKFDFPHESVYFNMQTENGIFSNYLNQLEQLISNLNFEQLMPNLKRLLSIGAVLNCFADFISTLENYTFFIHSSSLSPSSKEISFLQPFFIEHHLSIDFMHFVDKNSKYSDYLFHSHFSEIDQSFINFLSSTNSRFLTYNNDDIDIITQELLMRMFKPYVRYAYAGVRLSKSLKLLDIIGHGVRDGNLMNFTHISIDEAITFIVQPDYSLFQIEPPKITFIVRYFDRTYHRFLRVFPLEIQTSNDISYVSRSFHLRSYSSVIFAISGNNKLDLKPFDNSEFILNLKSKNPQDKTFDDYRIENTLAFLKSEHFDWQKALYFTGMGYNDQIKVFSPIWSTFPTPNWSMDFNAIKNVDPIIKWGIEHRFYYISKMKMPQEYADPVYEFIKACDKSAQIGEIIVNTLE